METLMNTHPNFYEWRHLEQAQEPMNAWSPRVDPESPLPFMPMEPIDLMTGGSFTQVPWIVGLTDDEGTKIQMKLLIEYISLYLFITVFMEMLFMSFYLY